MLTAIAEYALNPQLSTLSLFRSYTWGLDITRTLTDAGGVGALLQIADHRSGKTYFPAYDGNGNITALVNSSTGAVAAAYEYSPFGEPLRADAPDSVVADQPFRFSTKYTDSETGLVYYGRRYYDPKQGRFLGRDPKMEKGGLHLYAFCLNNPINLWDYLGMDPYMDKLLQRQSDFESEIQGLRDTIQGLIDDENNAYVSRGTHQSSIDSLNERIAATENALGGVLGEISAYGGTYTVGTGSDGTTGQFIDRDGNMGAFNFNSPTILDRSNGAITIGTDPQTGQTWTVWMQNQGLQDMTPMFFGGASLLTPGRAVLPAGASRATTQAVNVAAHGLRHFSEAARPAVEAAIRQDLAALGNVAPGQIFQRTITVGGEQVTYRGFGLQGGNVNVGTAFPGTAVRNIARPPGGG